MVRTYRKEQPPVKELPPTVWPRVLLLVLVLLVASCQPGSAISTESPSDSPSLSETEQAAPADEPGGETVEELPGTGPAVDPLVVLIDNDEGPITPANYN